MSTIGADFATPVSWINRSELAACGWNQLT